MYCGPCPTCRSCYTFPLLAHRRNRSGLRKVIFSCRACLTRWAELSPE